MPPRRPAVTLTFNLQNLNRSKQGLINILCKFHQDCSSHSWDIVVKRSVWKNGWTDKQTIRQMNWQTLWTDSCLASIVRWQRHIKTCICKWESSHTGKVKVRNEGGIMSGDRTAGGSTPFSFCWTRCIARANWSLFSLPTAFVSHRLLRHHTQQFHLQI